MAQADGKDFASIASLRPGHAGKPYLGDHEVVWKVLADMIEVNDTDPQNTVAAIAKATAILCGKDPAYAPMGPWNGEGIGNWIRGHMNGVPDEGGCEGAVEYALAHLVLHNLDAIKGVQQGADPEQAGKRLRQLVVNWTHLMLGIPGLPPGMRQEADEQDEDSGLEGEHDMMNLDEGEPK